MKMLLYSRIENGPEVLGIMKKVLEGRCDLSVYDPDKPMKEQFKGIKMVADVGGWATKEMIDAAVDVELWQILGTGLDHSHVDYMTKKGIRVAYCPGQLSGVSLAECAMMFILMLCRRYYEAKANFEKRILYQPLAQSLNGLTLGIIGFGASGQDLARKAKSFGMKIEIIEIQKISEKLLNEIQPRFTGDLNSLDVVLSRCDVVSLHVPLNDKTRHLIDIRRISIMKPDAILINVARGALVDEAALTEALLNGKLGGAGLDVFSQEPMDITNPSYLLPNVITTPHIAGSTNDTMIKRAQLALTNLDRLEKGLEPLYLVNKFPV
jgi:D-3-phosphoglycerate dehydrogenase / 2-oxoglutarate reductase